MKPVFSKTIGIIGGAGPMASAELYQRLIDLCQQQYGSEDYHEFPEIILLSFPFVRTNPQKVRKNLAGCLEKLTAAGADKIGLACNSFHGYLPDSLPKAFVNLIDLTLNAVQQAKASRLLVLSAPKTVELKLYERDGLTCLYPSLQNQGRINRLIRDVAGGVVKAEHAAILDDIIVQAGAIDAVILACTELPLIHRAYALTSHPLIIDTIGLLAQNLLDAARGPQR